MTPEERDRIELIVATIETEKDLRKYAALVQEMMQIVSAKAERLKVQSPAKPQS